MTTDLPPDPEQLQRDIDQLFEGSDKRTFEILNQIVEIVGVEEREDEL